MNEASVTKQSIVVSLTQLGVRAGAELLVHSSLSSFGHVVGGADAVIDALLEAVGPGGTVMVPTLTGAGDLSPANPPVFDVRSSKCWTGAIPEAFRRRPQAVRSLHPTHSVAAIGPRAKFFTASHETSVTPCGEQSPYYRLAQTGGYILLLGVGLQCCTLFHTVEELSNCSFVIQDEWVIARVTDLSGVEKQVRIKIHFYGPARNYPMMEPELTARGALRTTTIGNATVRLIDAGKLFDVAMRAVSADPDYLLA